MTDILMVAVAGVLAAIAYIVPRVLSGPAERPPLAATALPVRRGWPRPELAMGLQAAVGALIIVALSAAVGLLESAWTITACTYVVAGSAAGTIDRVKRRIVGTMIGVPVGLAFLPLLSAAPVAGWAVAAVAMIIYAMSLPERHDIACGAYAFMQIVTLAVGGEHSIAFLTARAWETLLGGMWA